MPAPSIALNASIDSLLHLVGDLLRQVRGDDRLRSFVEVLRLVVVELARRDDLAGHRRLGLVVAEHRALDLARVGHRGLDDDLAIEAAGERHRLAQPGRVLRLRDADARSQVGRLDEHRELQRLLEVRRRSASASRSQSWRRTTRYGQHGQAARGEQRPSSSPCPCRPPRRARRRRRRGCWRARAGPGSCRPRRRGRAASGR